MPAFIQNIDAAVYLLVQEFLRVPVLNGAVSFFTQLGDSGMLWIVISVIMLFFKKTRKIGFTALIAMLFGLICTNLVLKNLVARPRPYETVAGALPLLLEHDPLSFPSGHTCAAFAASVTWFRGLEWRWAGVLGLVLAALMGFSRMYVGVHYLSDVLAGLVVGILCSFAAWYVMKAILIKRGARLP